MSRNNYPFVDLSHHKGQVDHQAFANAGHRLGISKASDNYHLPRIDGKYDIPAEIHTDAYFAINFMGFRQVGLATAGYHFARFDRPLGASRAKIVEMNLQYYLDALDTLPPEEREKITMGILDMEQDASQLYAAGFKPKGPNINAMALHMVSIFSSEFQRLMFYSGSWWANEWLSTATLEKIAELSMCWEPEYISLALSQDKQNVSLFRQNYVPSLPTGFVQEWMTKADDPNGKLFAWQFSVGGRFPGSESNLDLNVTEMDKEEIFKLFGTDGAVDPPEPPPTGGLEPIVEQLDRIEANTVTTINMIGGLEWQPTEPPPTEPPVDPIEKTLYVRVANGGNNVYLSFPKSMNKGGTSGVPKPVYEFYPSSSAPVPDRVFVGGHGGQYIPILSGVPVKGDSGVECYEIDRDRIDQINLKFGSSPIPTRTEMRANSVAPNEWAEKLFIMKGYVVEVVEK